MIIDKKEREWDHQVRIDELYQQNEREESKRIVHFENNDEEDNDTRGYKLENEGE